MVDPGDPPDLPGGPPNVDSTGATLLGCDGSLEVDAGSVQTPIRVDLTALSSVQVALPDETRWFAKLPCSLTPHEVVFAKPVRIQIPFDRTFPRGGSVDDDELVVVRLDSFADTSWSPVTTAIEVNGENLRFSTDQLGIFAVLRPKDVGLDSLPFIPTFAAVLSDFTTTAIALLDEQGRVLRNSWVDSGTQLPILNGTISGDVVLPTHQPSGQFALVDRFGVDVVSRFSVPSGELIGQVRAQPTDPAGGGASIAFSTNPNDLAYVSDQSAWIARYNQGPAPDQGGGDPMNRGNDLLEIDPTTMTRTGRTVDMAAFNALVPKADENVESVPARPNHIVQIGNFLVVSLNRIGNAFDVAGTGALAIVNLSNLGATLHELTGFQNCGKLSVAPDDASRLFVSCDGFAVPFGEETQVRASGGIAVVTVDPSSGETTTEAGLALATRPSMPLIRSTVTALSSTEFVAVATGDFVAGTKDRLYYVDLSTEEFTLIAESDPFGLGRPAYDPDEKLLLLPDGSFSAPGIRRFRWDGGDVFDEKEIEMVDPALAPRQIYRLSR